MIGDILEFSDLQRLCRPRTTDSPPKRATVEAWARAQNIAFKYDGRGGIWTTHEALNAALGLSGAADSDKYDPNELG